jgi:hypothetical protein
MHKQTDFPLSSDLPRPVDDGAAIHLVGMTLPKLDGAPPGEDHGGDIDATGVGTVQGHRLYQLIRQKGTVEDRTFQIEFLDPGVEAFAFTFG